MAERRTMATANVEEREYANWLGFLLVLVVTGAFASLTPVLLYFL